MKTKIKSNFIGKTSNRTTLHNNNFIDIEELVIGCDF
jgi:hypothetical protein